MAFTPDARHLLTAGSNKLCIWPASDDVQVVGKRTREERDAEDRKRANNLEDASRPASKRRASDAARASPAEEEGGVGG